jgi:glycogen phosphorylase
MATVSERVVDPGVLQPFLTRPRVGYFSMEIALRTEIPTYSGGLGVLAGDTLRSAADLRIPLVAVTLVSRQGYFRQQIVDGRQVEHPDPWQPEQWGRLLPTKVSVPIGGSQVWIAGWLYIVEGLARGRQPVILLDTDLPENSAEDRLITHVLYGGDQAYRLKQEIVLGMGGVRMLEAHGFNIEIYHLNEGHSALLTLQLLERYAYPDEDVRPGESRYDVPRVREMSHFTTHTPVEAGHDRFSYDLVDQLLRSSVDRATLEQLAGRDELNTTRLALNLSEYVNGVAKSHAEVSERLFPGYHMSAITNGVHPYTWTHPQFATLYDAQVKGWRYEPELLMRADCCLSDADIWQSHMGAKQGLIDRVASDCGARLDPAVPIIGYARRMTQYKRPGLLFSDLDRLRRLAGEHPFQVVLAGKAHPRDESGKRAIEMLHRVIRELAGVINIAYLPNYNMDVALAVVSGADIWLNTPQRPFEASGTSGMKAALNGVPSLSVLDGWWREGHIEGITGWAIGTDHGAEDPAGDADALLAKLGDVVLPLYQNRDAWIAVMKGAISRNASMFNSHRMMRRYAAEAYLR